MKRMVVVAAAAVAGVAARMASASVTVVKDATADYSDQMMHAALDINIPNYASAIVMADEVVALLGSAEALRSETPATAASVAV
jgi:hypothetical protein